MTDIRIPYAQLQRFMTVAMERLGLPSGDSATVGCLMAEAELQGSDGHGVIRLLPYARRIKAGGMNLTPQIKITSER
ncbi:MAG: putative oxidoreductase YjmC, partial [Pseudomonadota bacterium]